MDSAIVVSARNVDAPRIAADLAVLNETAVDVRLDVDLHRLTAKRTCDHKLVGHLRVILLQCESDSGANRTDGATQFGNSPFRSVVLACAPTSPGPRDETFALP
jgi:hypothetical protein